VLEKISLTDILCCSFEFSKIAMFTSQIM